MREVTTKVFQFDELSDKAKERAREWWRDCEAAEGDVRSDDAFASLTAFCDYFGVKVTVYSVGAFSLSHVTLSIDRYDTEFGTYYDDNAVPGLSGVRLWKYLRNQCGVDSLLAKCCPFTGYFADEDCLQPIREFMTRPDDRTLAELIHDCADSWLVAVIADAEAAYDDESVDESIRANEYEFTENGERY
jgi:hypothetical protein